MPPKANSIPPDITACPTKIKSIVPFLQRAAEVRSADPVVAYWCIYNAARLGLPLSRGDDADSKAANHYVSNMLAYLENMKSSLKGEPTIEDTDRACDRIEKFGLRIFASADNEDREGGATRMTAKKFLAAANFLQLLNIFDRDDRVADKIRYAKWKAADIVKAYREGRVPQPGPIGGDPDISLLLDDYSPNGTDPHNSSFAAPPSISRSSPPNTTTSSIPPVPRPTFPSSDSHPTNLTGASNPSSTSVSPSAWSTVATPGPDYHDDRRREASWSQDSPTPTPRRSGTASFAEEQERLVPDHDHGDGAGDGEESGSGSGEDRGYWSTVSTPGVGIVDGHAMFKQHQAGQAQLPVLPTPPSSTISSRDTSSTSFRPRTNSEVRRVRFTESTTGGSDLNDPPPDSPVVELGREQAELGFRPRTSSNLGPGRTEGLPAVTERESEDRLDVQDGGRKGSPPRNGNGNGGGSQRVSPPKQDPPTVLPSVPTAQRERKGSVLGGRSGTALAGLAPPSAPAVPPKEKNGNGNGAGGPPTVSSVPPRERRNSFTNGSGGTTSRPVIIPPSPAVSVSSLPPAPPKKENGPPPTVPPTSTRERRNSITSITSVSSLPPPPPKKENAAPPTVSPTSTRERRNSITSITDSVGSRPTIGSGISTTSGPPTVQPTRPRGNSLLASPAPDANQFLAPPRPAGYHSPLPPSSQPPSVSSNTSDSHSRSRTVPLPSPSGSTNPSANTSPDLSAPGQKVLPSQPGPYTQAPHASQTLYPPPSTAHTTPAPAPPPASRSTISSSAPIPPPPPAPTTSAPPPPTSIDPTSITNAQKHARFAISALTYEDLPTARKELLAALALLGG